MDTQPDDKVYVDDVQNVIKAEEQYVKSRRRKADKESPPASFNSEAFSTDIKTRGLVGLAFSGGGIRSASFNLGVVQALSKSGLLPLVDYLSTISGGGYIGASLISLLGWDKDSPKKEEYHFNTQWEKFPFNPSKEIIKNQISYDVNKTSEHQTPDDKAENCLNKEESVSYAENSSTKLKPGANQLLRYLIEKGNFLTPRRGYASRDMLRFVGKFLSGTATMLLLYLLLVVSVAFFISSIAFSIPAVEKILKDPACVFDYPLKTELKESDGYKACFKYLAANMPEDNASPKRLVEKQNYWSLILGLESKVIELQMADKGSAELQTKTVPRIITTFPGMYLLSALLGIISSVLIAFSFMVIYSNLWGDQSDKESYNRIKKNLKRISTVWILALAGFTYFVGNYFAKTLTQASGSLFFWLATVLVTVIVSIWYWIFYVLSDKITDRFTKSGLESDNVVDYSTIYMFMGIYAWASLLSSLLFYGWAWSKFSEILSEPFANIFWLFHPLAMILGSFIGVLIMDTLIVSILFPFFNSARNKKSEGTDSGKIVPWGNARFRSVHWSWFGVLVYGFIAFAALALLIVPQMFVIADSDAKNIVPVSSALISAAWAALMVYLRSTGGKKEGVAGGLFTLPPGIWQGLFSILVIVLNFSLIFIVVTQTVQYVQQNNASVSELAIIFVILIVVFVFLAWTINLNEISLHYFYRDRISDAFLKSETFCATGERVCVRDDSQMALHKINPEGCSAPYHLVIGAINLSGSWRLAHKDRKSEHFLFSKYFVGSNATGYVRTEKYRKYTGDEGVTKYSRAIAISGAAFASALGIFSFFALTFMMTILNIRLGLWMVHPDKYKTPEETANKNGGGKGKEKSDQADQPDPMIYYELHEGNKKFFTPFWLRYLLDEAQNRVSERRDLINISDGGHTGDNAALYPLLQRRCKLIIAGDASADPRGNCEDLYRVIRMARNDLGVNILINTDDLKPDTTTGLSKKHVVIGRITYPQEGNLEAEDGWLVYVKPTITAGDRGEIRQYYETHKNWYPHPSTGDQWFDEWQFEAQRLLGEEAVNSALAEWIKVLNDEHNTFLSNVLELLFEESKPAQKISFNAAVDRTFEIIAQT